MFLSSYSPLFGVLAFTARRQPLVWVSLVAVSAVALLGLLVVLLVLRGAPGPPLVVQHSKPQDSEVMAYIASYLIPFFGLDLSSTSGVATFGTFLLVLGAVYVNSSLLFINPVLSCARFRSFEVEDHDGHTYALLTRRRDVLPGTTIHPAQITRFIRVEVTS
jgi:hypothetical protein